MCKSGRFPNKKALSGGEGMTSAKNPIYSIISASTGTQKFLQLQNNGNRYAPDLASGMKAGSKVLISCGLPYPPDSEASAKPQPDASV